MTVVFSGIWMLRLHLYLQLPLLHGFFVKTHHPCWNHSTARCLEQMCQVWTSSDFEPSCRDGSHYEGTSKTCRCWTGFLLKRNHGHRHIVRKKSKKMFLTGANQKIARDFSCIFQVGPAKNTSFNRQVGPDRRKHRWQNFARFSWGKHMISIWGFP